MYESDIKIIQISDFNNFLINTFLESSETSGPLTLNVNLLGNQANTKSQLREAKGRRRRLNNILDQFIIDIPKLY